MISWFIQLVQSFIAAIMALILGLGGTPSVITPTPMPPCASTVLPLCADPYLATPIFGVGYDGWIMTSEQANDAAVLFGFDGSKYRGFMPGNDLIVEAEAELPDYLASQSGATPRILAGLSDGTYDRQYFGYVYEFSNLMLINAYCTNLDISLDPANEAVDVSDGGDCFWHATYDAIAGRFVGFAVNGSA